MDLIASGAMIFGIVNLVRLIAERVRVGATSGSTYTLLVIEDVVLSTILIVGARGVMKGRRWAAPALLFSAGVRFVSSVVLAVWIWPYFVLSFESSGQSSDVVLGARLFFYALVLLAFPYAAVVLIRRREPDLAPRRRLSAWRIGGMAASGAFVATVIALHSTP